MPQLTKHKPIYKNNTYKNNAYKNNAYKNNVRKRTDNIDPWKKQSKGLKFSNINDMRKFYDYSNIRKAFPWAQIIRAGFICLYKPLDTIDAEVLLVQQKATQFMSRGQKIIKPPRYGPPKGIADNKDISAIDTALRELFEETSVVPSIEIIQPATIIVRRPELNELMIYYIALFKTRPDVNICIDELLDYKWFDVSSVYYEVGKDATTPTKSVLMLLNHINYS